ncbi:MAG TPA: BadF/BadG/BcrA/BcrD ATPase family protein [Bryobacteraceae bacterium]|nr:BadF/BadG/BcrA/BcrD ATPase family protein [Bryobacteraceae bacterium]
MTLYLGVDGGQSSTTAAIGNESGRVIGHGRGGPCNHVKASEGRQKFIRAMEGCLAMACASANLDPASVRFTLACLGFSGGPADKEAILHEILPADRIVVTHDGLIALSGATAGEPGILAIAGTGQFAFGRNAAGKSARAGGWGYIIGDEGGGFDIARQALRAALRMEEGWGRSTALREVLLAATGAADANDLVHRFYTPEFPRPRVAALSKLVDEAAISGDGAARDILHNAAQHLAIYAGAVRGQLFEEGERAVVAYIGGVFRSHILRERFRSLMELEEGSRVAPPVYGPAAGALLEAYRAAGIKVALTNVPESEK